MSDNPLLLKGANAVIAGGGAIGTAFANQLSARAEAGQVVVLARRAPQGLDARVQVIPLEATDPASVAAAAEACSDLGRVHLLINTVGLLHANGVKPEKRLKDLQAEAFQQALNGVCIYLARAMARDGEGATKLFEVTVQAASDMTAARQVARTVVSSPLVKTAAYGNDPNWGRILAAAGRSGAEIVESKVDLYLADICLLKSGRPQPH